MFGKRFTLIEVLGFKIKVDVSWAFLAILIAWSLAQGFFPAYYEGLPEIVYWWMGLAGVIGLFFSIAFHELSHSLVARQFGLPIRGITLFIFGGVAEMEEEPASPKVEFLMAIAGPVASVLLAAVFQALSAAGQALGVVEPVTAVTRYLTLLNLLLAGFNMLPAFPLDGGRILRAALWHWRQDLRQATRIASRIGAGFGLVLMAMGVLQALIGSFVAGVWWFLIGLFLRGAAAGSYYQLMAQHALEGESVRSLMIDKPVTVPPSISVRELVEDYVYKHHFDLFPVTEDSQLKGCITTRQIREVPRDRWGAVLVGEIAAKCTPDNTVAADEDAVKALSRMQRTGTTRLMVVDGERLVGIITLKDMLKLFALKMDLEEDGRMPSPVRP